MFNRLHRCSSGVSRAAARSIADDHYWIVLAAPVRSDAANYANAIDTSRSAQAPSTPGDRENATQARRWRQPAEPDQSMSFGFIAQAAAGTINGGESRWPLSTTGVSSGSRSNPSRSCRHRPHGQPTADTLTLADSVTTQTGKSATIGDTLALADALRSQAVFARTITDPRHRSPTPTAFPRDLHPADSLTVADLIAAQRGIAQARSGHARPRRSRHHRGRQRRQPRRHPRPC